VHNEPGNPFDKLTHISIISKDYFAIMDKLESMGIFVRVVERGSFSAAADGALQLT
jgi:hypothetical protein